jgi:hypothetical protein
MTSSTGHSEQSEESRGVWFSPRNKRLPATKYLWLEGVEVCGKDESLRFFAALRMTAKCESGES